MCIGVLSVYLCTTSMPAACRGLKRVSDPLELKLQMVVSHDVGAVSCFSRSVAHPLRCLTRPWWQTLNGGILGRHDRKSRCSKNSEKSSVR